MFWAVASGVAICSGVWMEKDWESTRKSDVDVGGQNVGVDIEFECFCFTC